MPKTIIGGINLSNIDDYELKNFEMIAVSKGIMECNDLDKLFMLAKNNEEKHFNKPYKDAKKLMPGGVNSPVRAFKWELNPIFFKSAKGPFLNDEDGNKGVDFIGSWGPMIWTL